MNFKTSTLIIALGLAGASAAVIAADRGDLRMLEETKITLTQAVAAAEQHQGGRAIEASLDDDSFKPTYEVSVVQDGRFFDVQVDGVTGSVIGSREDRDD